VKATSWPLVDLEPADAEPPAADEPDLFLGRLSEGALRRELEGAGILAALADRGYPEVSLHLDVVEGEHRLRVTAPGVPDALVELRASERTGLPREKLMRDHGIDVLYLLAVHWFSLQNPRASFTSARPRLPGQVFPGLGIGRRFFGRLVAWAHDWGKDGLLNFPAYYHNAVFFGMMFRFLSAARQGRFEALSRDLAALPVCDASAAVAEGRVRLRGAREPFAWQPAEMVAPVTRGLKSYMDSEAYAQARDKARASTAYDLTPASGPPAGGPGPT
jgi:hypothetical protein